MGKMNQLCTLLAYCYSEEAGIPLYVAIEELASGKKKIEDLRDLYLDLDKYYPGIKSK